MLRVGIPMDHPNGNRATPRSVAEPALLPLAGLSSGWQRLDVTPAWGPHVPRYGALSTHPTQTPSADPHHEAG